MVDYICTECGYIGKPKVILRGSKKVEVLCWVLLLFPGPFYSFWRRLDARRICTYCKAEGMLSTQSLEGYELMKDIEEGKIELSFEEKMYGNVNRVDNEVEGSFKGCIVQRDIRQEITELGSKNNNHQ